MEDPTQHPAPSCISPLTFTRSCSDTHPRGKEAEAREGKALPRAQAASDVPEPERFAFLPPCGTRRAPSSLNSTRTAFVAALV